MGRGLRVGASGAPLPDFFSAGSYVLGLNTTSYYLGWPAAGYAVSYSYSTDGGGSWTTNGTKLWAAITGRTASTTDHTVVRAFNVSGGYFDVLLDVALPAIGSPTVVVSVIGTGTNPFTGGACDYASPDLWEAAGATIAGNASLVTANKVLEGWLLNQEFLNTPLTIEGMTSSATCYRHITAGPGCSFTDHADRRTNPLRYNAAVGAAMRYGSVTTNPTIDLREGFSRCSRIQVASTGNGTSTFGGWGVHSSSSANPVYLDRMLVQSGTYEFVISINYGPHYITNCLIVNVRPASASAVENIAEENNGCKHYGCIFLSLGQQAIVATVARTTASEFQNCGFFGVQYLHDVQYGTGGTPATLGTGTPTYSNCFTDTAQAINISGAVVGLPTGVTQIAFDTSTGSGFESKTTGMGNYDARLKTTSALRGAGLADTTHLPIDITGKARATSGAIDVGPWQT